MLRSLSLFGLKHRYVFLCLSPTSRSNDACIGRGGWVGGSSSLYSSRRVDCEPMDVSIDLRTLDHQRVHRC